MQVDHGRSHTDGIPRSDPAAPLVACIDTNADLAQLLADYLSDDGFRTVPYVPQWRDDAATLLDFLTDIRPDACIASVSPPYDAGWQTVREVQQALPNCGFVVTTTNHRLLTDLVGPADRPEVISKPFDLDAVCAAVRRALGQ